MSDGVFSQSYYKAMMGEYIIYNRGKIVGGIYDELPAPKKKK